MFPATAEQPHPKFEERRASVRHDVHIAATLHAGGRSQPTVIDDLSTGGAGLNGAIGIFANERVEIQLANGRRLSGTVAWRLSGCCGIQFHEPLLEQDPLFASVVQ